MSSRRRTTAAAGALAGVLAASLLAACGSAAGSDEAKNGKDKGGKVTISVEGWRPGSEQATIDTFKAQVADFMKLNPTITVEPKEWEWKAETFATQLAGGTLPTTFRVPFTDGKGLIERGQILDVSAQVKALPYASKFNPSVLAAVQGADGKIYGLPTGVYGMGLHYNRQLFQQAGLDPDQPPTTWDELRADAKAIHDKTGQPGFVTMSKGNTGGWDLTTFTYAMGGRMESADGKTATVDNDATQQFLTLLQQMRWQDNSVGTGALLDWGGINQAFAAGKAGMYVSGSDVYNALVQQNSVKPDSYGLGLVPMAGGDAGVLGGGSIAAVSAKATPAQADAAVKWNDWYYMRKLSEQKAAEADAKTLSEGKQPVGTPQLPVFDAATLQQYTTWIKPYVNVPLAQMTAFTDGINDQELLTEPVSHTQELYALLDTVVQKVLTDKDADVHQVLQKAQTQAQALLDKQ